MGATPLWPDSGIAQPLPACAARPQLGEQRLAHVAGAEVSQKGAGRYPPVGTAIDAPPA